MAEKRTIRVSDLSVEVYEPQGAPRNNAVFCHGAWVGGWVWESFAAYLADQGYTGFVPTWRGHYDSKPVDDLGKLSVLDFVDDATSILRASAARILIGESMGGLVALKAAEMHRDLDALVLLNPAPPFRVAASRKVIRSQLRYLPDLLFGRPNMPQEADYKRLILNNVPEPDASNFYKRICADSGRALLEMSLGRIRVNPSMIRCPVLVVIGHLDEIIPLKSHRKVAELLAADVVEYPTMSHQTFSEEGWEKVAAEVVAWLNEKARRDSK